MSIGSSPFQGGGSASIADATESTAGKIRIATTSESNTGTNDVTAMTPAKVKARIDAALVGGVEYKGSYTGQSLVTADKGDLYVSAATYSLAGVQVLSGDHIIFNQDAADPVTSAMFDKIDNTDQVSSVNTLTGAVVLSGANLDGDHSSPSNYSATTDKIEKHLEGIDTALGSRQPLDAQLTDVAGLTPSNNHVIVGNGANFTAAQLVSTQLSDTADLARLASPALTGTPTAPTATSGTNTTQLATTAFVQSAVSSAGGNQITDIEEKSGSTFTAEANHIYICAYGAGTQTITFPDASSSSTGDIIGLSTYLATRSVSIVSSDGTTNDIKNNSNQTKGGTNGALSLNIHRQISWFVSDGALWLEVNAALSTVATTGAYSDLSGTPTLGTASANATTDFLQVANNLSDLNNAGTARTNLGLAIGSDVQAHDAGLDSISGLTTAADKMLYTTGSDTYAVTSLTSAGRALLDDADAAAQRTTLGLATVAQSGAYSDLSGTPTVPTTLNTLTDVSISSVSNGQVISYNSTSGEWENSTPASGGATDLNGLSDVTITGAAAGNLLERNGAGQFINVVKSTIDVGDFNDDNTYQPKDAGLTSISGLTTAADKMIYTTGSDTYAVTSLTAAGRALLDDADAAAQQATLGLGTAATAASTDFQPVDAGLTSISGLTTAADKMIYTTGSDTYAVTSLTSAGRALLDDADAAAQRTTLGLVIGTDVAAIASPAFTGSPTAPTQSQSDGSTNIATTAYVDTAVSGVGGGVTPTLTVRSSTSYTLSSSNAKGIHIWYGADNTTTFTVTMPDIANVISTVTTADGDPQETFEVYVGRGRAGDITISAADGIDVLGDGVVTYSTTQTVNSGQWIKIIGWYLSSSNQRYLMNGAAQAYDAGLQSISGLTTAADKMIYTTGSDTYAVTDLTAAGRALLDDADAAAQRTTLGLVIGTDVISDVVQDTSPQLGGNLDLNGQDIVTTSNANLELAPNGTGVVSIKGNSTGGVNPGTLKLWCENNSHGISIKSPPHSATASYELVLPTGVGTDGQVLKTDGGDGGTPNSVQLAWVDQSGGGGGGSVPGVTNTGNVNSTPYPASGVLSSNGIEEIYLITPAQDTVVNIPAASASAVGSGYKYQIKNLSGSYNLTLTPASGTIDGSSTYVTSNQYESVTLVSDGSNYYII